MGDVKPYMIRLVKGSQEEIEDNRQALCDYFNEAGKGEIHGYLAPLRLAGVLMDEEMAAQVAELTFVEYVQEDNPLEGPAPCEAQ